MKNRLYQKQVIAGEKRLLAFIPKLIKQHRKHIAFFILTITLALLLIVLLTYIIVKYIGFPPFHLSLVPLIVHLSIPYFYRLSMERKTIKLLKTNRNDYSEWMSLQKDKITITDNDAACRIVERYRDTYREHHDELLLLLRDNLKHKPANQVIVSVIAGLIFLSNDSSDFKTLFNAKYRHGAAGNMIPEIWIKLLDPQQKDTMLHSDCSEAFISYWSQRINQIDEN